MQKSRRQDQTREIDMSFRQLISSHWERDQQGFGLIEELGFSSPMNRLHYVPINSLVPQMDWTSFLVHRPSPPGDLFGDGSDWFPGEESTGGEGGLKVGKEENKQGIIEQEDEQGFIEEQAYAPWTDWIAGFTSTAVDRTMLE